MKEQQIAARELEKQSVQQVVAERKLGGDKISDKQERRDKDKKNKKNKYERRGVTDQKTKGEKNKDRSVLETE